MAHLTSLAVRSSEPLGNDAFYSLLETHGPSLRCLRLKGVPVDTEDVRNIAAECTALEKLLVPIPVDDIVCHLTRMCNASVTSLCDIG